MLEHLDDGALGFWSNGILRCCSIGMLEHWDTGTNRRCNHKFKCGILVEFNLSADCIQRGICPRTRILHSLGWHICFSFICCPITIKLGMIVLWHKISQGQ